MADASVTNTNAGKWLAARYDFTVHGGAVGDIPLRVRAPKGAVIINSFVHTIVAPTSGGSATIAIKLQSAGDILAATAYDDPPFDGTFGLGKARYTPAIDLGTGDGSDTAIDDSAAAAFIALTAERELTLTIGTAALTAGEINIFIQYVVNATA